MSRLSPKTATMCGSVALFLLGACGDRAAENTHAAEAEAEAMTASTQAASQEAEVGQGANPGAQLYAVHCALCHGEDGDGQGIVPLDRPARSFRDGGFSFGNTPEAIFRTVSNGIGGTPMPGFAAALSEEERRAVVDHVLTLMPEQVVVAPGSTVLEVLDRPQVARGSFPPVAEGLPMSARGLLVGGLDGLSFQYDATDLRLLAVRLGGFVDRKDWENRGGDALLPLGQPIYLCEGGAPGAMWHLASVTAARQPLRADLLATEVRSGRAWIEYALVDEDGIRLAVVRESGQALSRGGWTGFRRSFEVRVESGLEGKLVLDQGATPSEALFPDLSGTITRQEDPTYGTLIRHRQEFALDGGFHLNEDLLFGLQGTETQMAELKEALR